MNATDIPFTHFNYTYICTLLNLFTHICREILFRLPKIHEIIEFSIIYNKTIGSFAVSLVCSLALIDY